MKQTNKSGSSFIFHPSLTATVLVLLMCCGCSTAPVADFLDYFYPAKIKIDPKVQPYGGVCGPDGGPPNLPALPPISIPSGPPPGPTLPGLPPPPAL